MSIVRSVLIGCKPAGSVRPDHERRRPVRPLDRPYADSTHDGMRASSVAGSERRR
jgi:hypothetical protein